MIRRPLVAALLLPGLVVGCAPSGEVKREQEDLPRKGPALSCAPGAVNDRGVGKRCATRDDCAGQFADYCDMTFARIPMCTRFCNQDADCGAGAMCGVRRGVRKCYPTACVELAWTEGCEDKNPNCTEPEMREIPPGEQPKHEGAILCAAGVAFAGEGFGLRCDPKRRELHGGACQGKAASMCQASYYPSGLDYCEHECRRASVCGEYGYCGWMEPIRTFSVCFPRCPEPRHRLVTAQPESLDRCNAEAGTVPAGKNAAGVGLRCRGDAECAGNRGARTCGSSIAGAGRKPDVCTMPCASDGDCGHNAVCVDLDFNLHGDGKPGGSQHYCLPACWIN